MPKLIDHQSSATTKLLFIGDSGCLTGDTIVSMKRGGKPRKITLAALFKRFRGRHHNKQKLDTFLLADKGGYAGLVKMVDIVRSGKKEVFQVDAGGQALQASAEHQFSTPLGWLALSDLSIGSEVHQWRSTREKEVRRRDVVSIPSESKREYVYSIPYHPFGQANVVAGREYKRAPRAHIIVEAQMNGLAVEELILILRTNPTEAARLSYIPPGNAVHHLDGNWLNDELENLQVINNHEHTLLHHPEAVRQSKATQCAKVTSIQSKGEKETFDIVMEGPEHNFIANGFVVHNSGKTGALASLAAAGYNLRIIDTDNGMDVLANLLKSPDGGYAKKLADGTSPLDHVDFETITDPMRSVGGKMMPTKASVWQKAVGLLDNWKTPTAEFGPLSSWTSQEILVIDTLTTISNAALNFILAMNGRLGQRPHQSDWYDGQLLVEGLLQKLYDEGVKCNVIVNAHVTFIGEENGPKRGYPASLGSSFPPKIGRYFNTILMARTQGSGQSQKRKILTNTTGLIELKNTAPTKVKPEYDLTTGLAEYFRDVKGEPK